MVDYLIVGQGVAGTLLSHHLQKRDKSVHVVDPCLQNASTVAAGNINPITGRSYTKTWMLEELLEEVVSSYRALEALIRLPILSDLEIFRTLRSVKDKNKWMARVDDLSYSKYIGIEDDVPSLDNILRKPLSYGRISGGYQVNTKNLIEGYRKYLTERQSFIKGKLDYDELDIFNDFIRYQGVEYKHIVFTEGFRLTNNPFFNTVKIEPTRGDVLIINIDSKLDVSLRDQTLITPYRGKYWVGSNYDKTFSENVPCDQGRLFLQKKLDGFLLPNYEIVEHLSGVRPCTYNRRPILGVSDQNPNIFVFNGLGTKGTSLAPYFAKHMVQYLIDGTKLMEEVDIKRFKN